MGRIVGGRSVAETLKGSGVDYLFGMTGGQTAFTASAIKCGIRMMTVHDEKCGALMATGYARIGGRPGVCTAADIGAAHLALGLYEADRSAIPVLAITSDLSPSRAWRLGGRFLDQDALFAPITKWSVRVKDVEALPQITRRALEVAAAGSPGPVAMIVPNELFGAEFDFPSSATGAAITAPIHRPIPDPEAIGEAARLLRNAKRPAIVIGGGVVTSQAQTEVLELAEFAQIPVATTHVAQGAFPTRHPLSLGIIGDPTANGRGQVANDFVATADVVLLIGTKADGATTRAWQIPSSTSSVIQVGIDPAEVGANLRVDVSVISDARAAVTALTSLLRDAANGATAGGESPSVAEVADRVAAWRQQFGGHLSVDRMPTRPPRVINELQKQIDDSAIIVSDAGSCSYWIAAFLDTGPDNSVIHPRGFPALGSGFPLALGAQVAAPHRRVICISGDGGFGYNIMELETAVRLNLPVVNLVLNNQTLGMEWRSFMRFCGTPLDDAVRFAPQNFTRIAEALGCFALRVERPQDISEAVAAALDSQLPAVIEVMTDPAENSDDDVPWRNS